MKVVVKNYWDVFVDGKRKRNMRGQNKIDEVERFIFYDEQYVYKFSFSSMRILDRNQSEMEFIKWTKWKDNKSSRFLVPVLDYADGIVEKSGEDFSVVKMKKMDFTKRKPDTHPDFSEMELLNDVMKIGDVLPENNCAIDKKGKLWVYDYGYNEK